MSSTLKLVRTAIIIALMAVAYLMVLEWNRDFGDAPATSSGSSTPALSSTASDTNPHGELDTPETAGASPEVSSQLAQASATPVVITTDVLRLTLDPVGGVIRSAELLKYPVSLKDKSPFPLLETSDRRTYFAQVALLGKDGFYDRKFGQPPHYRVSQNTWTLRDGQETLDVDLTFEKNGIQLIKRFTLARNSYEVKVRYLISNQSDKPFTANLATKLVRDDSPDPGASGRAAAVSFHGPVFSTTKNPYEKVSLSDLEDGPVKETDESGWIAFIQHYFAAAIIPQTEAMHVYQAKLQQQNGRKLYLTGFVDPAVEVAPGAKVELPVKLYMGPKVLDILEKVAPNLDLTVDYGWLWWISKPLFLLLKFIHGLVGNWGVAIILLTVLVKAAFYKLSAASYRSMARMRKVAPELQRLRELYGDDRQKMSQAMMELYRKQKINPLGGCLPILVQMPVFIALYWVLLESVELRQAPFFGWIQDLSIKDPYFILPLLMGASMYIQTSLNPAPPDPMQAKMMRLMPVIFTVFFLWFPAGLVLYWLTNNILSIAQQWMITRTIEKEGLGAPSE